MNIWQPAAENNFPVCANRRISLFGKSEFFIIHPAPVCFTAPAICCRGQRPLIPLIAFPENLL
ncbi:hypothetical protein FDX19_01835 [Citrobacter sp. wls619]|nr:hypothetical protein FDX19_01835 [Citrobacter sp. wls619]